MNEEIEKEILDRVKTNLSKGYITASWSKHGERYSRFKLRKDLQRLMLEDKAYITIFDDNTDLNHLDWLFEDEEQDIRSEEIEYLNSKIDKIEDMITQLTQNIWQLHPRFPKIGKKKENLRNLREAYEVWSKSISQIKSLEENWDDEGAPSISPDLADIVNDYIFELYHELIEYNIDLPIPFISPGYAEINIQIQNNDFDLAMTFPDDSSKMLFISIGDHKNKNSTHETEYGNSIEDVIQWLLPYLHPTTQSKTTMISSEQLQKAE